MLHELVTFNLGNEIGSLFLGLPSQVIENTRVGT